MEQNKTYVILKEMLITILEEAKEPLVQTLLIGALKHSIDVIEGFLQNCKEADNENKNTALLALECLKNAIFSSLDELDAALISFKRKMNIQDEDKEIDPEKASTYM